MTHLETARKMLELGTETITGDKNLFFAFLMCCVEAGIVTEPELIEMLRSKPPMAEFEKIAAEAWQRQEGGER